MDEWSYVLPDVPAGDIELRHGYTLGTVNRLATAAAMKDVWHQSIPLSVRLEITYCSMVEYLYKADAEPTSNELISAAWKAVRRYVEDEWHTHGVSRTKSVYHGAETMPNFQRYWSDHNKSTPSHEDRVIDRLALPQVWSKLRPRQQELLIALAVHRDYESAAASVGVQRSTFISSVGAARRDFYRFWYEHEKPPRKWGVDRPRRVPNARRATIADAMRMRRQRRRKREEDDR